jgi:hypothetical protein
MTAEAARQQRALKRALLSVTVYHQIDFRPADDGIVLEPGRPIPVSWAQCRQALGNLDPAHPIAPDLLARMLRSVITVSGLPDLLLAESARVVGLPVDHVLNPGLAWVVERVHGDVLDLGLGILGLDETDPRRVVLVPPVVWEILDADPLRWWRTAMLRLEEMGTVAASRLAREPDALRPIGDADALTLLGSRTFRSALAAREGGMAAVAIPMRNRGWTRMSLLDPAFAPAAALATDPVERGFSRGVLVTADEVAIAGNGDWTLRAMLDGRLHAADFAPVHRA